MNRSNAEALAPEQVPAKAGIPPRFSVHPFFRSKVALTGIFIVLVLCAMALFAPVFAPFDPNGVSPADRLMAPSMTHFFGTDHLGRDVYSRVVYGARTSITVSLLVVAVTALAGGFLGLIAGYYRRLDVAIMSCMDGLMAFPGILLAIALVASLGPSPLNVVIALSIVYTPRVARTVRASTLMVREQVFVESARALGAYDSRILARHIFPNCLGAMNVQVTFIFAYAILAEAALSFLGVGAPPPTPSWGNILSEGRRFLPIAPWMTIYPGFAIMVAVLALNLLGDELRDLIDPRLRATL
ncbi:ABC transporter permease [Pelagibius sp.]|uniref:ABC transporter permease n=1 Tax=Pelagibius sp. TaxID=1931238 RepID=UPI003BAF4BE5